MKAFRRVTSRAVVLDRPDVDTDQIIPKQFLKRIERSGFGEFLFFDWRKDPGFELNGQEGKILLAGRNFGCGSSREHAVWALADYGFRAILAPSFADIFATNATKNGIATIALDPAAVAELMRRASAQPGYSATVDLEKLEVRDASGFCVSFTMDAFRRSCLLDGLDEIALTLRHEDAITAFEHRQQQT